MCSVPSSWAWGCSWLTWSCSCAVCACVCVSSPCWCSWTWGASWVCCSVMVVNFLCEICCVSADLVRLGSSRRFGDGLQPTVGAVMTRNPGAGVLGVEDGIDDELANVIVLQAVKNGGSVPTGAHQACHPQLGQVLGNRRRRLAHVLGEFVD